MEKVFSYKKILQILWNKYFKATFNFTNSNSELSEKYKKISTYSKYQRKIFNPENHKTKNPN